MANNNAELELLVRRSVQGDKDAFERLCRLEAQPVIYYCTKVLGNRQDGEDAAQEVFIQMQQSIHSLKAPEAFVVWVRKLILNVCGKMRRKGMNYSEPFPFEELGELYSEMDENVIPEEYANNKEKRDEILAIIDGFSERTKVCLLLHYFEQYKISEIADMLSISEGAVKSHLYLGRQKLRNELLKQDKTLGGAGALLPMTALGGIFAHDMQSTVTQKVVTKCLQQAGVAARPFAFLNMQLAKQVLYSLVGTVLVVGVGILVTQDFNTARNSSEIVQQEQTVYSQSETAFESSLPQEAESASAQDTEENIPVPPVESAAGQQTAQTQLQAAAKINGTVQLVNNFGGVILEGQGHTHNLTVEAYSPTGALVGKTATAKDGSFAFEIAAGMPAGYYRLQLRLPEGSAFVPAGNALSGEITVLVNAPSTTPAKFYVCDSVAPVCNVTTQSNDCDCGHVNPLAVVVDMEDDLPTTMTWKILSADRQVVAQGEGDVPPQALQNLAGVDGLYYLVVAVQDAAGNVTTCENVIWIDSGPIDDNQYA